jgi:hypothetical protein
LGGHNAIDEGADGNVGTLADDGAMGNHLLGLTATGGVHPLASPTAPDSSDDGSNAPLAVFADVNLPVNGSGLLKVGNAMDAGSGDINGPPVLPSALYPLFLCGNAGLGWRLAQSALAQTAACNKLSVLAAEVGGPRTALRESPPLADFAALPVIAIEDTVGVLLASRFIEGVAQCALGSLPADGITKGVAQRALGPSPSHAVVGTAETAVVAFVARPGTAVCMDGYAGGTCIDGHAWTFVQDTIIVAMTPVFANPYMNSAGGTAADTGRVVGGAVGDVVAPGDATAATAGTAPGGDTTPAGGNVQGVHWHFMSHVYM